MMRKLGKPANGESRRITRAEARATNLSGGARIVHRDGIIEVHRRRVKAWSIKYYDPRTAEGETITSDEARRRLENYWEAKAR